MLCTEKTAMQPDELIRAILRMPADLLWNGGIGTYVKASTESHADVGDRSNDNVRVNASQLRCKVVGEGGNLGLTQRARIEFSLNGCSPRQRVLVHAMLSPGLAQADPQISQISYRESAIFRHQYDLRIGEPTLNLVDGFDLVGPGWSSFASGCASCAHCTSFQLVR